MNDLEIAHTFVSDAQTLYISQEYVSKNQAMLKFFLI